METTNNDRRARIAERRRNRTLASDCGSVYELVNAGQRAADVKRRAQVMEWNGRRAPDEPQHPTSRQYERTGRVEPRR